MPPKPSIQIKRPQRLEAFVIEVDAAPPYYYAPPAPNAKQRPEMKHTFGIVMPIQPSSQIKMPAPALANVLPDSASTGSLILRPEPK